MLIKSSLLDSTVVARATSAAKSEAKFPSAFVALIVSEIKDEFNLASASVLSAVSSIKLAAIVFSAVVALITSVARAFEPKAKLVST